ncbi:MAG: hypothetical protein C7B47_16415 [Sulfobacillus thermosulfidooxidans]|uniref:Uncharacterized protein n=1 Tax=Sulfobacillus thermosulfidooxidans TaxID=28034 RepID=A0A2T2WKI4_SULTH|nr:MAG: hypothetical protein C7B47_16415 [Sulfobacillus thermosulfidooxidans]
MHWGLPLVLSSGLLTLSNFPIVYGSSHEVTTIAPASMGTVPQIPLYPHSLKATIANIDSPFTMPLVGEAINHASSVWQVREPYDTVENWYVHHMEQEGYHLISRVTHGLLFAKGSLDTDQVGINILPLSPSLTDYQFLSALLPVSKRPAASYIASASSVRFIDVTYRAWRYGSAKISFVLTNPREIASVIQVLNHEQVLPPALYHCAADFGQGATLAIHFRNGQTWQVTDNAACETVHVPLCPPLADSGLTLYHLIAKDAMTHL